ncbi:MAG: GH3 auxin-responsive promoter family protein [Phycisphaerae bacterium]
MSLKQFILRPIASIAGRHAAAQLRAFLDAHRHTEAVQDALLRDMLQQHAPTAFGRDHGFSKIRTYEDFTAAVPVRPYEQLRPYFDRVLADEPTALLPPGQPVLMFSQTSGTTGKPKSIPVTPRFLADIRRGWNVFGLSALRDHPDAWLRYILQISSPKQETTSPSGLPCGAISGLLAETQKRIVRRMYCVPPTVSTIKDPDAKYYTTLRCGIGRDVAFITTANPSSTIRLIETGQRHVEQLLRDVADGTLTPPGGISGDIGHRLRFRPNRALARQMEDGIARDGQLLPRHFWNISFLANWTGGTLKLYLNRLRELFGNVPIRDIGLLASEGRFTVPLADDTPAGVAEITGNFLEFIPSEEKGTPNPTVLRAHQVQVDHEYSLVVTNRAGLFRYDLDDRVRVTRRLGNSPVFEFLSRGKHTASITGEKITEHQVVEAMRRAADRLRAEVDRFIVQGRFAPTPYYELQLETADPAVAEKLATALDEQLGELNMEYHSKRSSGRLGPMRPIRLPRGTLQQAEENHIRRRRGRGEQYKHQYLMTDVRADEPETSKEA